MLWGPYLLEISMAVSSLLPATVITAAGTLLSQVFDTKANGQKLPLNMAAQANLAYGSGGTTIDVYIQTSYDQGATWCDVMNFHFTTANARSVGNVNRQTAVVPVAATDGSLTANTKNDGVVGRLWRAKVVSVGTYAGNTTLTVDISGED
jgi:uncharacterized protein YjlB